MSSESDEARAALTANDVFYTAFSSGDTAAMNSCWSSEASVLCTHPGAQTIHGRDEVMESWRQILENGPPSVRWSDGRVAVIRGVALVSCIEWLIDGTLMATNVFIWEDGSWKLVHHHAGPLSDDALPDDSPSPSGVLH